MESNAILETVNSIIFGSHGVWFLIGAALVYFMQAGFAMCEAGFTRAKNVGNIIMKNLMDFCLGTVAFIFVGYNILCGDASKFWGGFTMNPFDFGSMDCYGFVFNLVFCATCATIVSGAMAERTKFLTYCIYSFVISLLIYPIEAHWVWGGTAWLTDLGFTDFAGSAVIHMVGGVTGFIGACFLGPRIGKYDKNGHARPILGHNISIAALGVFILWFGWYGFNGAAAADGLFYGGGVHHLLIQLLGVVCIAGWAIVCDLILFTILKKTVGVRVSEREELEGLDATEHGLETGYAGFLMDKDN